MTTALASCVFNEMATREDGQSNQDLILLKRRLLIQYETERCQWYRYGNIYTQKMSLNVWSYDKHKYF